MVTLNPCQHFVDVIFHTIKSYQAKERERKKEIIKGENYFFLFFVTRVRFLIRDLR